MRIALVSDIHGNLPALEAVAGEILREGVDQVLNLGDIVSGPLWPAETARWLMARDWPTIRGNHERQVLADRARMGPSDGYAADRLDPAIRAWLAGLPAELRLADGAVAACHGSPGDDLRYLMETVTPDFGRDGSPGLRAASAGELHDRLGGLNAEVLVCGHSHVPRVMTAGPMLVVNPGSVGLQAYDDVHPHVHWVETGSPHARWALLSREPAGWSVALRCTPYDWAAAARQADDAGRPDWADALRCGRVGRTEDAVLGAAR
jgi:predicted phosphodiesterase